MKLAFVAAFDIKNVHKRSGTPFYMTQAFEQNGVDLNYISPLKTELPPGFKIKRFWQKLLTGKYPSARSNTFTYKRYAHQVTQKLTNLNVDAILTHIMDPLAYLENKLPSIVWTDAIYSSLKGIYPEIDHHSAETIREANAMTQQFLTNCRLAIFSSEWAAEEALKFYDVSQEKIKVVPFGANLNCQHTLADIREIIRNRSRKVIKLLFVGKEWQRKGGDIVVAVAKELHAADHAVELNLVGSTPPYSEQLPNYIKCLGYISKKTPEGLAKIEQLLRESHFLFVPSRAEAYGIVFCEANAFGLPCLTSFVGGIPTIVKNDVNGMVFPLNATTKDYCNYIMNVMQDYSHYEALALSSFHEYESRLNWTVAVNEVKKLINDMGVK